MNEARMWMRPVGLVVMTLVGGILAIAPTTHAGDRPLEIVVVNMTPDGSGPLARRCAARLRGAIRADYTQLHARGETAARARAGEETAPNLASFMTWGAERLDRLKRRGAEQADTVLLFDCRPEGRQLDVTLSPPGGGVSRLRVRDVELDAATLRGISAELLRQSWVGFSP